MEIDINKLSLNERAKLFGEELQPFMDSLNKKYNIALQANIQLVDTTPAEKVEEKPKDKK